MARIYKGILGGFSGKVGNVVGTNWRGIDVIRSLPKRSNRTPTQNQLDQQEKFGLMMGFMSSMSPLVTETFKAYAKGITNMNAAVSYNLQNAISGVVAPFNISFPNVLVSRGDLPNANNPVAVAEAGNKVKFSWGNNDGLGKAKGTDKVILVVYCDTFKRTVYVIGGNLRSALSQSLTLPEFTGETVETWVAFITDSGAVTSNSVYTGSVNIEL